MRDRQKLLKKFEAFYKGNDVVFQQQEIEQRDRLLFIMELKIKELYLTDKEIFDKTREKFNVSYMAVLHDILIVERMIANEINPNGDPMKVFVRYFIGEITKEAINKAKDKNDAYTMAYSANILGKHYLTDKEDVVKPNYEDIVPFTPELTLDPSVIGITLPADFEEKKKKYLKKFDADYQHFVKKLSIPEADIIENEDAE